MRQKSRIQTQINNYSNQSGTIDFNKINAVRDFAFLNTGTTNVTIRSYGVGQITIQPGDPLLTFGGYDDAYRIDRITYSFSGSSGNKLIVFITKDVSEKVPTI